MPELSGSSRRSGTSAEQPAALELVPFVELCVADAGHHEDRETAGERRAGVGEDVEDRNHLETWKRQARIEAREQGQELEASARKADTLPGRNQLGDGDIAPVERVEILGCARLPDLGHHPVGSVARPSFGV